MIITGCESNSMNKIQNMADKDEVIRSLVDKFGIYRTTEKLRTERKKFNREKST